MYTLFMLYTTFLPQNIKKKALNAIFSSFSHQKVATMCFPLNHKLKKEHPNGCPPFYFVFFCFSKYSFSASRLGCSVMSYSAWS